MKELSNFPKIECPFVRKIFPVNVDDWKKHGKQLQLREPKVYLATPEITPGYEWVFERLCSIWCIINADQHHLILRNLARPIFLRFSKQLSCNNLCCHD